MKIYRDPEEVFAPDHLASILGKSVVNDHPPVDVTPENFREYHAGHAMNVRRGDGALADCIIADLIIMDPQTIKDVQSGKREVSMGYDCDYEEVEPGIGKQHNIIANHVALVEAGRCGVRCSIKDHKQPTAGGKTMKFSTMLGKLLGRAKIGDRAVRDLETELEKMKGEGADAEAIKELEGAIGEAKDAMAEEASGEHTHVHVHMPEQTSTQDDGELAEHIAKNDADHQEFRARLDAIEAALAAGGANDEELHGEGKEGKKVGDSEAEKAIEGELKEEAPAGTGDQAVKAKDSIYLADSFQDTVAGAEILAPGIRYSAFDAKAPAKDSLQAICSLRRKAIDLAYGTAEGRGIVDDLLGGKSFDLPKMSCGEVRGLFRGAVTAKRAANNAAGKGKDTLQGVPVKSSIKSIADMNAATAEYWSKHS